MNLTERIRERFVAAQARLADRKRSIDRDAVDILAEAHRYAMRADHYRARKEANTRPADLLSDSQKTAVDELVRSSGIVLYTWLGKAVGGSHIANKLGLCKEYVDDYLLSIIQTARASA